MGKKSKKGGDKAKAKKAAKQAEAAEEAALKAAVRGAMFTEEGEVRDVLADFGPFCKYTRNDLDLELKLYAASTMPEDHKEFVFGLTKSNMADLYKQAEGWPDWDDKTKEAELMHETSRHIVALKDDGGAKKPVAFCHFRFELEGAYPVCYVYELQLCEEVQRRGLGKHFMQLVELVARKNDMKWIMLTVLNGNDAAYNFYTKKLSYSVDETSPAMCYCDSDESYDILSKCLDRKIVEEKAAEERRLID